MNKRYKGKRVMLIHMEGEPQMKNGIFGTIAHEDDVNQIHVQWDNGSCLAIQPTHDFYKILTDKELRKIKLNKIDNKMGIPVFLADDEAKK